MPTHRQARPPLLAAQSITLHPAGAPVPVLKDLEFTVNRGETTAVLGLSGSGKTVLLQLLAGRLNTESFGASGSLQGALTDESRAATDLTAHLFKVNRRTSYVPPDDVVFGFDTPRKAIVFRHRLAFGSTADEAGAVAHNIRRNTMNPPGIRGIREARCRRGDSNSHGLPRRILSALRLPFRHSGAAR